MASINQLIGVSAAYQLGDTVQRIFSGFAITLILLVGLSTAIGLGLARLGVDDPEMALLPAVVIAWLIDGIAGGLTGIALATISGWFFFMPPAWSFRVPDMGSSVSFLLYIAVTAFVCYVVQGQKNRIAELLDDNLALNRRLLDSDNGSRRGGR
jgi:K+-sensing histidine kinase KdpD